MAASAAMTLNLIFAACLLKSVIPAEAGTHASLHVFDLSASRATVQRARSRSRLYRHCLPAHQSNAIAVEYGAREARRTFGADRI
jgi:hypothetical protein